MNYNRTNEDTRIMSGKKTEISRGKRKKMFAFFGAIVLFLVLLAAILYYVFDEKTIGLLLFMIGLAGPIISLLLSLFVSEIRVWIERWKIWSNPNLKWYIGVFVLIDIVVFLILFKIIPTQDDTPVLTFQQELNNDSFEAVELQRQFNELDERFKYRIKDYPTFDNARHSLVKDSIVLTQIIQMLNENPELSLTSINQYIDTFNERVDSTINIIKAAISDTTLNYSEYKAMTDKYNPIIDEIEQMKIDL